MDCQQICRSVDRTQNFVQFLVGAILFEFSSPITRITLTAVISDQVRRDLQESPQLILTKLLATRSMSFECNYVFHNRIH